MDNGKDTPDLETVQAALDVACRAPSVHNTQPWCWAVAAHSVHLFADTARQLPVLDPNGRAMTLSCGAALHHARIAFAALGWQAQVHRSPNPHDRDHLAAIEFAALPEIDGQDLALVEAATHRRTDRRPFLNTPVPATVLDRVARAADDPRVQVTMVTDPLRRRELVLALAHADLVQRSDHRYLAELRAWTHQHVASGHGVLAGSVLPARPLAHDLPGRDFGPGDLESPPAVADGAILCVLSTRTDDLPDWLRTGEALSAVLLEADAAQLATCTLSQIAETRVTRNLARLVALDGVGEPQVAVRIGRPVTEGFPGPATPRRPRADVVRPWTA